MSRRRGFYQDRTFDSRRLSLFVEHLEVRSLLSATDLTGLVATAQIDPAVVNHTTPVGLTPAQIAADYGFSQITVPAGQLRGAGQTIAIIDAYDDPNIRNDLAVFDSTFGLAAANLSIAKQYINGVAPQADSGWAGEIALDVEWAHAMAPGANILLVETADSSLNNLLAGIDYARSQTGVSVISMSWGASEFRGETSYDSHFTTPAGHTPITFVASAGDDGAGAIWPAVSTNVLGVGGTTLNQSGGAYVSESAWSDSGGGYSRFISEPSYQTSAQSTGRRSSPDVAFDANPSTGVAVYDSVADGNQSGWFEFGGTSAGAPQWAALIATVNQDRVAAGKTTLSNTPAAIYGLPSSDFHDITTGGNGYRATVGYDPVTGRGSPIANLVVQGLVGSATVTSSATAANTLSPTRLLASGSRSFVIDDTGGALTALDGISSASQTTSFALSASSSGGQELAAALPAQSAALAAALQSMSASATPAFLTHGWLPMTEATSQGDATESDDASADLASFGLSRRSAPLVFSTNSAADVQRSGYAGPLEQAAVDACFADGGLNSDLSTDITHPDPVVGDDDLAIHVRFDDGNAQSLAGLTALALISAGAWKLEERAEQNRRVVHNRRGFALAID